MLTSEEMKIAIRNNLDGWPWDIRPSYPLTEEESKVILMLIKKDERKIGTANNGS